MESNNETIYATMQHKLKRSKYVFGRYSVSDLIIIAICTIVFISAVNIVVKQITDPVVTIVALLILILFYGVVLIVASANMDIYHNGIGLVLCILDYHRHKVTLTWGGVCCEERQEDESNETSTESTRRIYERRS